MFGIWKFYSAFHFGGKTSQEASRGVDVWEVPPSRKILIFFRGNAISRCIIIRSEFTYLTRALYAGEKVKVCEIFPALTGDIHHFPHPGYAPVLFFYMPSLFVFLHARKKVGRRRQTDMALRAAVQINGLIDWLKVKLMLVAAFRSAAALTTWHVLDTVAWQTVTVAWRMHCTSDDDVITNSRSHWLDIASVTHAALTSCMGYACSSLRPVHTAAPTDSSLV